MLKELSPISKFYLLALSMIPFVLMAVGKDNPQFATAYLIWVGFILLVKPSFFFEAFRDMSRFKGIKVIDEDPEDFEGMKRIYGCLGIVGGIFLMIIGIVTTFFVKY